MAGQGTSTVDYTTAEYTTGTGTGTGTYGPDYYTTTDGPDYITTTDITTANKPTVLSTLPSTSPQTMAPLPPESPSVTELLLLLPLIIQLLLPLLQPSTTPATTPPLTTPFIPRVPPLPAAGRPSYSRPYWQGYHYHYYNPFFGPGYIPGLFRSGNNDIAGKLKDVSNRLARIPDIKGLFTKKQNPPKLERKSSLTGKGKMSKNAKETLARVPKPKPISYKKSPEQAKKKLYRRIPVPSTNKYVTIQTKDLMEYVTIFYNKKRFTIKTKDIIGMKTISDIIRKIKG